MPSWLAVSALLLSFAAIGGAGARGQDGGNRLINPGAESGATEGWQAAGFRAARYGESAQVPPADFARPRPLLGAWLFQATAPDATMRQVASFGDLATAIDGGRQDLLVGGFLGGAAGSPEGMRMSAQPLDAAGGQLGAPVIVGPSTAADRTERTVMADCFKGFNAPVGMRALEIRVAPANVVGQATATADTLHASEASAAGGPASSGQGSGAPGWNAETGCLRYVPFEPARTPSPPPRPRSCSRRQSPPRSSQQSPAPAPPVRPVPAPPVPVRVSCVVLRRTRLSLRVSRPATVRVRLARRAGGSGAAKWRHASSVRLRARSAGTVTRRLRALRPGRYRLTIRARGARGGSSKLTLTRTVKRKR